MRAVKLFSSRGRPATIFDNTGEFSASARIVPSHRNRRERSGCFGERVCAYVELRADAVTDELDLDALTAHLATRGTSKELFPEVLVVVDHLPRSSGGKVAKGELRADVARRASATATRPNHPV